MYYLLHRFAGLLAQDLVVEDHDGGERTGTEAGHRLQRYGAVVRGLARLDLEVRLEVVQELPAPTYVAGSAGANRDAMQTGLVEAELRVETGYALDQRRRHDEVARDGPHRIARQVPERSLGRLEHRDDR